MGSGVKLHIKTNESCSMIQLGHEISVFISFARTMQVIFLLLFYHGMNVMLGFKVGTDTLEQHNKLRAKLNKMLNRQKGSEFFLDVNEFEYPRANETLRTINKKLWEEYYVCLKQRYAETGLQKTMFPTAVLALEGRSIKLRCHICISPIELQISDTLVWYFNNSVGGVFKKILETSDHIHLSPTDGQLIIYDIKSDQAGQYWCEMGDTIAPPFYLYIDNDIDEVSIVYPNTAPNMPHAMPIGIVPEYNLKVYTTWMEWSSCSTCDIVGKKTRYGYCTLSLLQENEFQETIKTIAENKTLNTNSTEHVKTVFFTFKNKLPCKAKYVPKHIQDMSDVKKRKTEMMIRLCRVVYFVMNKRSFKPHNLKELNVQKRCPKNIIFEIRDRQGNVLESANNSAGIYSMVQGMPAPSPLVVRTTIYQKHNKKCRIICPGNLNTDAPITWKMGNKILNPSIIKQQTNSRMYISPQMHIIFEKLRFKDANIYSCWQNDQVAGIVKLTVSGEIELEMNQHVVIIGGILIVIVFLLIFWRAFQGRRRFTMH